MASKPRRTPNKPSPRPLPPPEEEEEDLINPFRGRALRRSPPSGAPVSEEPEPELPPTPTQKGISDPTSIHHSPTGIHNTPTKRPRRSRALAERIKSSPLKQPPLRLSGPTEGSTRDGSPSSHAATQRLRAQPRSRKRKRRWQAARNIEQADPLAKKKRLRDSLLAEVARLQSDTQLATRETDRLYQLQQGKRISWASGEPKDDDDDGLLGLLGRHALPPEKEVAPGPAQDWLEAATNPISFLPFSQTNTSLTSLFAPQRDNLDNLDDGEAEKLPSSHHPVPMTAQEELPYLQVFTPLTFTSTVSILPRDDHHVSEGGPLLQKHVVSASSTPPGLFAARIEMTVNTKNLSITQLSMPRLEPSAVGELAPFVEKIVQGKGTSALTRNVSVLTWAMSEWLRVATRRARFWSAVERDLKSSEALARCARETRKGTRRKGPGRPALTGDDDDDDDDDGDGDGGGGGDDGELDAEGDKTRFTKSALLPHMGRSHLDLELPGEDGPEGTPSIRIQWRITFDWTGEAQSKMGLLVEAPAKWHGRDTRGSLTSIPGVFDQLLREKRGPMEALRTVVALLVGEG